MSDPFELKITGEFIDLCGTWTMTAEGWGRKATSCQPVLVWNGRSNNNTYTIRETVGELIDELRKETE